MVGTGGDASGAGRSFLIPTGISRTVTSFSASKMRLSCVTNWTTTRSFVEAGQLCFLACVLPLATLARRAALRWPALSAQLPAYAIGCLAAWWTLQRIAACF